MLNRLYLLACAVSGMIYEAAAVIDNTVAALFEL